MRERGGERERGRGRGRERGGGREREREGGREREKEREREIPPVAPPLLPHYSFVPSSLYVLL